MPRKVIGRGICGTCLEMRKLHRNLRGPIAQCRRCLRRGRRKDRKRWKKAARAMGRAVSLAERFVKWTEKGGSADDILPRK